MKKERNHIILLIFLWLMAAAVPADAQKPVGVFLSDSLTVGKPVRFSLSYRHSPSQDVFFPDSSFSFSPFRFVSETFIPTRTAGGLSVDSVIYQLVSYEIDSVQRLSLPVFVISEGDSLALFSNEDSVYFKELVSSKDLDSAGLKANVRYLDVQQDVDYPKILYYLLVVILCAGLFFIFFGEFLVNQFRMWKFNRRHKEFVSEFKKMSREHSSREKISESLILWKRYMEWLENKPYTSLTTPEILRLIPNERLEDALKEVDSAIYGSVISTHIPFAFRIMLDLAGETYRKQRKVYKESLNR